jgi:hypothetical protein
MLLSQLPVKIKALAGSREYPLLFPRAFPTFRNNLKLPGEPWGAASSEPRHSLPLPLYDTPFLCPPRVAEKGQTMQTDAVVVLFKSEESEPI